MTNTEIEAILKQFALLTAKIADALAPLVERTQPQPDPMGDIVFLPTPNQTAQELRQDAARLLAALGIEKSQ
jgi:type IV pilus biogenesis protein CpaD/CtpE